MSCTSGFRGSQNAIGAIWEKTSCRRQGEVTWGSILSQLGFTNDVKEGTRREPGALGCLEVDGILDLLSTKARQGQQRAGRERLKFQRRELVLRQKTFRRSPISLVKGAVERRRQLRA